MMQTCSPRNAGRSFGLGSRGKGRLILAVFLLSSGGACESPPDTPSPARGLTQKAARLNTGAPPDFGPLVVGEPTQGTFLYATAPAANPFSSAALGTFATGDVI